MNTAAVMLTGMPVAGLSLNELSRRVGLAKSNVLRYFESREAVLLELLEDQLRDWTESLAQVPPMPSASPREKGDYLAKIIAEKLIERPMLCDLVHAQVAVLERNVSVDVVVKHKRASHEAVEELCRVVRRHLPELEPDQALTVVAFTLLMIGGAWPHSRPPVAVLEAYKSDPAMAATRIAFGETIEKMVALTISGLLADRR